MKENRTHRCSVIGLMVMLGLSLPAAAQIEVDGAGWGTASGGLRIAVATAPKAGPLKDARLAVSLQNTGEADVVLNLGSMLANGRVMHPDAVHLIVVDPFGTSRELQFSDRRYSGVAGRMDDFIVSLRAGATYIFTVALDQYWSPSTKEIPLMWVPGIHRISARFDGRGAAHPNSDTPGIALLNFWRGAVTSGTVEFDVR